jgi:dimeric dUTPase (all-alpha-NTP-PPase superfamily)
MDHIEKNHPRQPKENRFSKKILALLVELGECANEERCFKFWSNKARSPEKVVLEEFVDGLHFILDLGIETYCYLNFKEKMYFPEANGDINIYFLQVFKSVMNFFEFPDRDNYKFLLQNFITLGAALGFTWEEIEFAYFEKMDINHQRQENGY